MKIVFFGDIHMETGALKKIEGDFEHLIITGDLSHVGGRKEAMQVLEEIKAFYTIFQAVPGNMDQPEINELLDELGVNIHGKGIVLDSGIGIFGCGSSAPTPFNTPNELPDEEIYEHLKCGLEMVRAASIKIMVCHTPPINCICDKLPDDVHVGSPLVRKFIENYQPDFCLSGHIHEGIGQVNIGKTIVANPGAFMDGHYGVLDTDAKTVELF